MLVFLIRSYIFSTLNSSQEKWKWFWLPWFLSGVTTSWSRGSQFKMLENDWQLIVVHSYHNLSFLSVIFNIFGSNYETFFMTSGMFKCMSCINQANIWGPSIRFAGVSMIRRRNDASLRMQMIKSWWAMTAKIYSVLLSLFGYLTVNWLLLGLHESALFLKASVDFNRLYACTRFHMATLRDSLAQICGIPETQQPPPPNIVPRLSCDFVILLFLWSSWGAENSVSCERRVSVSDALVFQGVVLSAPSSTGCPPSSGPRPSPSLHIIQWPETRGPKTLAISSVFLMNPIFCLRAQGVHIHPS